MKEAMYPALVAGYTSPMTENAMTRGDSQQAALIEEFDVLWHGETVTFPTEHGMRQGKVSGCYLYGGGNTPWRLGLYITYRGSKYSRRVNEVSA